MKLGYPLGSTDHKIWRVKHLGYPNALADFERELLAVKACVQHVYRLHGLFYTLCSDAKGRFVSRSLFKCANRIHKRASLCSKTQAD